MGRRLCLIAAVTAALLLTAAGGPDAEAPRGAAASAHAPKKCGKKHRFESKAAKRRRKRCRRQGAGADPGSPGAPGESTCADASAPGRLAVFEDEFTLRFSRNPVQCGSLIVQQQNQGEDPHDLKLQKAGAANPSYAFEEIGPGLFTSQTVSLGRGSWNFFCSLPGHREAGMEKTLSVN